MWFDQQSIDARLGNLPPSHLVVFAALCAEFLMPAYKAYSDRGRGDDVELVSASLDEVWNWVDSPANLGDLIPKIESQLPGEGYPWTDGTEFVESAVTCVMYALMAAQEPVPSRASWALSALYEAADSAGQATVPVRGAHADQLEVAVGMTRAVVAVTRAVEGFLRALEGPGLDPSRLRVVARGLGEAWQGAYLP